MNEPITPKAEHHVVEGEFVETDAATTNPKQAETSKQAQPKSLLRNPKQPWLAMLAMTGVLLGATSWIALEQRTATLYEMAQAGLASDAVVEQQLEQQIAPLLQKIAYQQQKITALENWQQSFQGGARSFLRDYETLEAQLVEMQALLAQHAQDLAKLTEQNSPATASPSVSDGAVAVTPPVAGSDADSNAIQAEMQMALSHLNQELAEAQGQLELGLAQLRTEVQRLQQQADQALAGLQALTEDPQWQAGQAELANQLNQFQQRLSQLANEQTQWQADWLAKLAPEVETIVTEITPTFEGLLSRFNHLFTLKKVTPMADESTQEQGATP
jgi:chromosome segregation ATPase